MKKLFSSLFTLSLALTVVISTVGIRVYGHSCSEAGISKYSVWKIKPCCKTDDEGKDEDGCCSSTVKIFSVDAEKQISKTIIEIFHPGVISSIPVYFNCIIPTATKEKFNSFVHPPPDPGREILLKNCISRT